MLSAELLASFCTGPAGSDCDCCDYPTHVVEYDSSGLLVSSFTFPAIISLIQISGEYCFLLSVYIDLGRLLIKLV